MAWRAGFQFVSIACCGSRKCEADKRYEEREIGKMQGMLEHDDSDREMESLDGSRAQDLLLGVEASDNRGLQIEEEGQNDDDLQDDGAIQDDGAVRDGKRFEDDEVLLGDGEFLDSEEAQNDITARDDELVQDEGTVRYDGLGQDDEGQHDNTTVQRLDPLDYAAPNRESIEFEGSAQSAPASQDYAAVGPIGSHMLEHEAPVTPPTTTMPPDLPPGDCTEDTTGQIGDPVRASSIKNLDLMSILTESKEVCDRTMSLRFPGDPISICEYPEGQEFEWHHCAQIRYDVTENNSLDSKHSLHQTAYFAMQNPEALNLARIVTKKAFCNSSPPFCNFNLSVLRINKVFRLLGLVYLYKRNFRFQCSAKGTKKFLFKKYQGIPPGIYAGSITQLDLFYHFQGESSVIETDDHKWRRMIDKVRHHFSCIPKIHIHVGHGFWAQTDWW
jgi:hypothetical protein